MKFHCNVCTFFIGVLWLSTAAMLVVNVVSPSPAYILPWASNVAMFFLSLSYTLKVRVKSK